MKNWEKVNEVWDEIPGGDEGTDHWRQICHAFNVDPDAEYVEPAKPQPEAEYDAGWVEEFYDALLKRDTDWEQDRADLCKEAARRERETEARRADTIVCIANGEDPGGYEDSTAMIAVRALRAERDELLWCNANQKRLLEQYQARLRERQPPADLAELVRLAESVDTIVNERRYIDPLFVDQSRLILRLAQAVAGMGGGK